MRRALISISILVLVLACAGSLVAQHSGSGILSGVVLGPDDKPVPHAGVTYQSSAGTAPHAVHADSQGRFTIRKLRSDNYDLRASGKGVFSEWEKNVTVRVGTHEIGDFAPDLRKGDSEGIREEQGQAITSH